MELLDYLTACQDFMRRHPFNDDAARCEDCDGRNQAFHLRLGGNVVIGCQGYWQMRPLLDAEQAE